MLVDFEICQHFRIDKTYETTVDLGFRSGYPTEPQRPVFASLPPVDQSVEVLEMLERLMGEDRIYLEEGLTIGRLAAKVGQPEHRLRRLINGNLGYRNFNQFLNKYRIEEAARQLTSADTGHLPVLSIALEVGYRSLAPFNKAFKERHGMTPTEYRSRNVVS